MSPVLFLRMQRPNTTTWFPNITPTSGWMENGDAANRQRNWPPGVTSTIQWDTVCTLTNSVVFGKSTCPRASLKSDRQIFVLFLKTFFKDFLNCLWCFCSFQEAPPWTPRRRGTRVQAWNIRTCCGREYTGLDISRGGTIHSTHDMIWGFSFCSRYDFIRSDQWGVESCSCLHRL